MPELFGKKLSKKQLQKHLGDWRQVVGVELYELSDGSQRGVRVLEFKTGSGLLFTVLIDRSMDFGRFEYKGTPFAWQSGTGFRHPQFMDPMGDGGNGFMRGFSGLLCTCGLDHIRQPDRGSADHFDLPLRQEINYPMHGRVSMQPAQLHGYGIDWKGEEAVLWCEGTVSQVQVMGEYLSLTRRIEVQLGSSTINFTDTVQNHGFSSTPHMLLYHINLGWPLLDENSRFAAPIIRTLAANMSKQLQQANYRIQPAPQSRFVQQVFDHEYRAEQNGRVPTALINDRLGLGLVYEFDAEAFRCLQQWQGLGEGVYGFGIEPATSHWGSRNDSLEKNEIIMLEHDQKRIYKSSFSVLDGANDIQTFDQRLLSITPLITDGYPERVQQPKGGPLVNSLPKNSKSVG
jgi:hypothetical protein